MIFSVEDITRMVKVALDLNHDSTELVTIGDVDTLSVDEIIASKVEDGARSVLLAAPTHLLGAGHVLEGEVFWENDEVRTTNYEPSGRGTYVGRIMLPDDFLRLIAFQMSDWSRAVITPMSDFDPGYAMQRSGYAGLRGTPGRPVCVLTMLPEGPAMEFYSCRTTDAYMTRGNYVPQPHIDELGNIDLPEQLRKAVVYMIASYAATAFGDGDKAKLMSELAQGSL